MSKVPANLKVCIFDVFGTVVDWRGSLIQDLPALGKKYGIDTDWTSFADDWRGLYQPQMGRVRKGELPWTRIDDLHKEAFEMLLQNRGLKHPGEEGAWEFTHLWHRAPAVARFGRGHRHDEEEVRRGHASATATSRC
jgi:2-haloacid dehalogenase